MPMTLIQLEYVIALDTYRHFATAAEKCFVTQPTLSMQIQRLEDNLGVMIFDRSKQPVVPTEIGAAIIEQSRTILSEAQRLREIISDKKGDISGELRLGIIPTIAPYLLPIFLMQFLEKYPNINLIIKEMTTAEIVQNLKYDLLDCAILATPLNEPLIFETPLFYEPFVLYVSPDNELLKQKTISLNDTELNDIWLLNDSHCMRSQVLDICKNYSNKNVYKNIQFESGSLETLKKLVNIDKGVTFLPQLSTHEMSDEELAHVRFFSDPEPVREISMITHRNALKRKQIDALRKEVINAIPEKLRVNIGKKVVPIV
jgi:LysR family hydrogen peroxide-inducible transcriptional activator